MENDRKNHLVSRWLMPTVITLGAGVCANAVYHLPVAQLDVRFWLLAAVTLSVGCRLKVQIPHVRSEVTVSETFIFLTMLLYDGEAAVLLAALDAFLTSWRFSKRMINHFFNAAVMACSYCFTVWLLRLCFGPVTSITQNAVSANLVLAIGVMALGQYVVNSGLIATVVALRRGEPVWHTWRHYYLYTSITYVAGASTATLIAKLVDNFGFFPLLATAPIVAIVYLTYHFYLKNDEAKSAQVEQAERHVQELSRHIAEQERISKALQESEEHFRNAFDYASTGMALVAPDGRWLRVNRSLCKLVGYTESAMLAGKFQTITHPEDLGNLLLYIHRLLEGEIPSHQMEQRYLHTRGHAVWVSLNMSLVRNAEGEPLHFIFQIQDITDRKSAEERLLHDAFHDALTGLPNRALFMDHLTLAIERTRRSQLHMFAVLFLDLDRFKVINDSLGHMIGDQLLIAIARRLEACLRPGDTVARLGGDEFTILLDDIRHESEATDVAERIKASLSQPFSLSGHEVFTGASIGIAPSAIGYESADDILRDADTAMYRAKSLGKMRHEVFVQTMHSSALHQLQMETDLRRAVEREEFQVYYQPIISLATGTLEGFEALVRWQHPERGMISPGMFIPLAEETGLILPLGRFVLREACDQMRRWQEQSALALPLTISVNLSSKQFLQADLIDQIKDILQETKLDPRNLKLEITESVVMENIETATEMLRQLRALGVSLSIDDFGTGYSSLSYLHRFPINTLKIDRSFVSQMTENNENMEIVRTIVMLAHNLNMDVVAEGVETVEQLAQLNALGCQFGQGYFFSKPIDRTPALALILAQHQWTTGAPPIFETGCVAESTILGSSLLM